MPDPKQLDPWEQEAAQFKPAGNAPAVAPKSDDWKIWQQNSTGKEPSWLSKAGGVATDVAKGVGEGLIHTGTAFSPLLNKIPKVGEYLAPSQGITAAQQLEHPANTAQKVGKFGEQTAEWLLPTGAEEKVGTLAAEHLPQYMVPAAKMATAAVESGARNKLQGGDFSTGAAAGGIGSGIGMGLRAVAPKVAESALNIRKLDRAYGKSPGEAILSETQGIRPSTIAESAQNKLNELTPQLESAANASPNRASLDPAKNVIQSATDKAAAEGGVTTHAQLQPMAEHLQANRVTGMPHLNTVSTNPAVNQTVAPKDLLNIKRGFGDEFVHRWNPETMSGVKGTAAQGYHALADEFNRAVPEGRELNSHISSLIPVAKRAESAELNAPTAQRLIGRFAAHTGALTGAGIGGAAGYKQGGLPGMIAGGTAGLVLPEAIASPTGQMALARMLSSPGPVNAAKGGLLQLNRKKDEDEK